VFERFVWFDRQVRDERYPNVAEALLRNRFLFFSYTSPGKGNSTTIDVEIQSTQYSHGLIDALPVWQRPLPLCYQSTGIETLFANDFDPAPLSRSVFALHRPETKVVWAGMKPLVMIIYRSWKNSIVIWLHSHSFSCGKLMLFKIARKLSVF
jgi:hypothetical protein